MGDEMQGYLIEATTPLADRIYQIWVRAPHVARNAQAGHFAIIRTDDDGERIPLTISAADGDSVRLIFMAVGRTTYELAAMKAGDRVQDIAGPLGRPSEIHRYGTVAVVGGGVGIACLPIIARAARDAGNRVIGIIGARNDSLLILEDEMAGICDELHVATDDGSRGTHGFVSDVLKRVIRDHPLDAVWVIGPAMMMKVTAEVTRPAAIRTFVSLNPIMVDGTGMCGSCRVVVGGRTRFACVDGPEFDAHQVDFDLLMRRQRMYLGEEKEALEEYHRRTCVCGGRH